MTHNDRVLQLLSDGKPHSHHELYNLHVIAHSRVSDLRAKGHTIRSWREGELHLYQLEEVGSQAQHREAGTDGGPASSSWSGSSFPNADVDALSDLAAPIPGQLDIFEVLA